MKQIIVWLTFSIILLIGCQNEGNTTPTPPPPSETAVPSATPEPTLMPTNTPRPSPTPIVANVTVAAQTVDESGELLLERLVMPEAGWVVVFNERDGEPSEVIGATAVPFGVTADLSIPIDVAQVTDALYIQLFQAGDDMDEFDPSVAQPLTERPPTRVMIDLAVTQSALTVADQQVDETGQILLEQVLAAEAGWVVIFADDAGEPGAPLGAVFIEEGVAEETPVQIRWREATNVLHARLLTDNGRLQRLELDGTDTAVLVAGEPVAATFNVTLPIDIYVLDQPLADGNLVIDRITVPEASWLTISFDEDGEPGLIIGIAPLEAGVNELVVVDVIESAVTDRLYIQLHEDTNPGDAFDLPANDPPLRNTEGIIPPPIEFNIFRGSYLITADQPLGEQEDLPGVVVPLAVVDEPGWIIIHADADGELGEIIGQLAIDPGLNRDLFVPIDAAAATTQLFAATYLNAGDPDVLELEEGIDIPFQRSRRPVFAPFMLLSEE